MLAMKGNVWMHCRTNETLPDGSRLYLLNVPVKPENAERKKGFCVAMVRCAEREDWDFASGSTAKVKVTEMHMTYCDGNTSSFSSCSGERVANDEEALWAAATYLYCKW